MTQKLEKRSFLGIDTTPRFWLWDEIARLDEDCKRLNKALANKQDECNRKQARIEQLETQAGTFVYERENAEQTIKVLEDRIEKMTAEAKYLKSELETAEVTDKIDQPRKNSKFTKKEKHGKPAE